MQLTMYISDMLEKCVLTSSVTADGSLSDDLKNIIIDFQENTVTFVGTSPFITLKQTLLPNTYNFDSSDYTEYFSIKAKEIIAFLSTFKGKNGTVTLENINKNTTIKCTVFVEGEPYGITWFFENVPVKMSTRTQINSVTKISQVFPMKSSELNFHLKSLYPILQKDTSLYGYVTFGNNHIIAYNQYYTMVQNKKLIPSEIFSNMRLYYKYVNFLSKVLLPKSEEFTVGRTDRNICFFDESKNLECYIIYDTKVMDYQHYLDLFTKQHYVSVDRKMFETCTKRASLIKDDLIYLTLYNNDKFVEVKNTKGVQYVQSNEVYNFGSYPTLTFSIMPKIINSAVLVTNREITDLRIYYCPNMDNDIVVLSDSSEEWFTLLRVQIDKNE